MDSFVFYGFMLIFIGFGGFEALGVRGPGAAWGSLGRPGAAWGGHTPSPIQTVYRLQITGCLGTSGWMLGHWAPRG